MLEQITEDHSERLRSLEEGVSEIKTATALHTQAMTNLAQKIDEGFEAVRSRLDEGTNQFKTHEEIISAHKEELVTLKAAEAARVGRWVTVKKAVLPLTAAAAGVLATKGGEAIWQWIEGFFK